MSFHGRKGGVRAGGDTCGHTSECIPTYQFVFVFCFLKVILIQIGNQFLVHRKKRQKYGKKKNFSILLKKKKLAKEEDEDFVVFCYK